MHNSTLKFNFSCPSDHVWNNKCKALTGFQLSGRAGFVSSPWDWRGGFQDLSTSSPREGTLSFPGLGCLSPHLGIQLCFASHGLAGKILSVKVTRLWGHICGTFTELLPWTDTLTHHKRYKHLHSGLSPSHTIGTFRKLIIISLHTSKWTHGAHTERAKPFQERYYYFSKHTTVQLALNRTLFYASDFWILGLNFIPEKDEKKRQESLP